MKEIKSEIIDEIAKKGDGLTVPDGYFDDFALKMSAKLPFREELDKPLAQQTSRKNSAWMRVRPYVYMAAMFAGAWCLIKMFSLMSPTPTEVTLENYPSLSKALESEEFVDNYIIDDMSSYDIAAQYYYDETGEDLYQPDEDEDAPSIEADEASAQDEPTYILPGSNSSTSDTDNTDTKPIH